jgi:hypothetical protein
MSLPPHSDPARWRKLWHPALLNVWQHIALVGLIMTAGAHVLLHLMARNVADFNYLYVVWSAAFVLGSIRNLTHTPGPDDDHHHH